jgi:hypothetical protein
MGASETPRQMAERHVREGEKRVARQEALVAELDRDGHGDAAARARDLLTTLRQSLQLAREHAEHERRRDDASVGPAAG